MAQGGPAPVCLAYEAEAPALPREGSRSNYNVLIVGQCHDGGPCHIFVPVTGVPIHGHCHRAQNKPGLAASFALKWDEK